MIQLKSLLKLFSRSGFISKLISLTLLLGIITSLSYTKLIIVHAEESYAVHETSFSEIIQVGDWIAVFIFPPVEGLWVKCNASKSSDFRVSFSTNDIQAGRRCSIIYMQPKTEGIYNLLLSFYSSNEWNGTVGVYTLDYGFYGKNKQSSLTPQGYFIELRTIKMKPNNNQTANYRIIISIIAQNISLSAVRLFNIKFPAPISMVFFALIGASIAYINAFFVIDSYFRSKTEEISKTRWVLIILLIVVSLYVLYYIYQVIIE